MKNLNILMIGFLMLLGTAGRAQTFTSVDVSTGIDSSDPSGFASFNGKVLFRASDPVHGMEAWISDGTQAGTVMLTDIWPGTHGSNPHYFTVFNNKVYFSASDSVHGMQVWVTDGTPAGTGMFMQIGVNGNNNWPYYYNIFKGKLYFSANDSVHGYELWSTDGTVPGTNMIKDIYPGSNGSYPANYAGFTEYNNRLYFDAGDSTHGTELWSTDGTTVGTTMVSDIWPGAGGSSVGSPGGFVVFNSKLYFCASDSVHGKELWVSDGTNAGTNLVRDIWPGINGSNPGTGNQLLSRPFPYVAGGFTAFGNQLYFSAMDSMFGSELWATDGSTAGTYMVSDIWPGTGSSAAGYTELVVYNSNLFFTANDSTHGRQVYSYGGGMGGPVRVTSLGGTTFSAYGLTPAGNLLYFIGNDNSLGYQLYVTDGTDTGTHLIMPAIAPNPDPLYNVYSYLFPLAHSIVFPASYTGIGREPWFYTYPVTAIGSVGNLPNLHVYPNPFSNKIMVEGLLSGQTYHVTLTDMLGNTVAYEHFTGTGNATELDVPATAAGIYLLHLTNGENATTLKLVRK